jgi:hypothetical protein
VVEPVVTWPNAFDDGYTNLTKKYGQDGAKLAESHAWPLDRAGEISKALGIGCEYHHLPVYQISEWPRGDPKHDEDVKKLKRGS